MGVAAAARALGRLQYRIARIPFHLVDDTVMPLFFDDAAPARLAYEWVLIECDEAAAILFDDDFAATHAQMLRRRSAAVRYAIARGQRQAPPRYRRRRPRAAPRSFPRAAPPARQKH